MMGKKLTVIVGTLLLFTFTGLSINNFVVDFYWEPEEPLTINIIHFYDSSSNDAPIVSWLWDFGDGTTSDLQNPTHQYVDNGTYDVTLTVTWWDGSDYVTKSRTKEITVLNTPPIANAGEDRIVNHSTVIFNGNQSYDPDGEIVSWLWDFGDNSTGEGMIVEHHYTSDGIYKVTLNVTDDDNAWAKDYMFITVDTYPPVTYATIFGDKGLNDWYRSNVSIQLISYDNVSGVKETLYKIDNGTWTPYTSSINITSNGEHRFQFYAVDNAGNKGDKEEISINIDKEMPSVRFVFPEKGSLVIFGRSFHVLRNSIIIIGRTTFVINATDNVSGINRVCIYYDNILKKIDTQPPYDLKVGGAIGKHEVKVKVYDVAENLVEKSIDFWIFSIIPARDNVL